MKLKVREVIFHQMIDHSKTLMMKNLRARVILVLWAVEEVEIEVEVEEELIVEVAFTIRNLKIRRNKELITLVE